MLLRRIILTALLYSASIPGFAACTLSADKFLTEISHANDGGRAVISKVYSGDWKENWMPFMNCLSSGDEKWMKVAVALAPLRDAAWGEDFNLYVGKALSQNAVNVLRIVGSVVPPEEFCDFLDNDPPENMSDIDLDKWYIQDLSNRLDGLDRVKAKDLLDSANKCSAQIQKDMDSLQRDIATKSQKPN